MTQILKGLFMALCLVAVIASGPAMAKSYKWKTKQTTFYRSGKPVALVVKSRSRSTMEICPVCGLPILR